MGTKKRGVLLATSLLNGLFSELIDTFSTTYDIDVKTLKVFQLYGFGTYDTEKPSLRGFVYEKTNENINGKYLYNKIKLLETSSSKTIHITRDYLTILLTAIGYDSYRAFVEQSEYITEEIRQQEENPHSSSVDYDSVLYYVGYYVEDKNYFIKSKLTIYEGKTADWDIRYWESDNKPSFYSYTGKVVANGDSALSFYFPKEHSNIKKECFVNVFSGNNLRVKPILLGSYCGFGRSNNPVIGKVIFERVNTAEEQSRLVLNKDVNPIFYQSLYSKRISVEGLLPHTSEELVPSSNYREIMKYILGAYHGFLLDNTQKIIPISFKVVSGTGAIEFEILNKKYFGIGRLGPNESFLNIEFEDETDNQNCSFSFEVKPIDDGVFRAYALLNIGALVFSGQVVLWQNSAEIKSVIDQHPTFSQSLMDHNDVVENHISKYMPSFTAPKDLMLPAMESFGIPASLKGLYELTLNKAEQLIPLQIKLDKRFEITTEHATIHGSAFYLHGNLCLLQYALNDISVIGLYIIFVGNTSKKQILQKKGVYAGYDESNQPISLQVELNSVS